MFLAIIRKRVIDTPANLNVDPPVVEVSHTELDQVYIEIDAPQIAKNLAGGLEIQYYQIKDNGTTVTLKKVSIKSGPRASGTKREVVEIEAGGTVVGSATVEA